MQVLGFGLAVWLLVSCSLLVDPSRRAAHEFARPDGRLVFCHEPPAGVVARGVQAEIDAQIPDVLEVLRLRIDVTKQIELLRPTVPRADALEALEFRLCVAWAQGVVEDEEYRAFLRDVLPALRAACGAETSEVEIPGDYAKTDL